MLAIIPARGGSKEVSRKNIRTLGGKPLIHWTIEAAINDDSISRVILSTDDKEIAELCRPTGIEIPFMRPDELAQDNSLAIDNYIYTKERLFKDFKYKEDEFTVLLPTVPFRTSKDIDNAIKIFYKNNSDSVISCNKLSKPIDWMFSVDDNGIIKRKNNEKLKNRQESEITFSPNGAIYVLKYSLLKEKYSYYSDKTYAYIMPEERSLDIDTEQDFKIAEFLVNKNL